MQHDLQTSRAHGLGWKAEWDVAVLDALLGTADALRDGRFGDEEGARDFRRREPSDRAQCERELRRRGEGGMSAEKEQGQRVVFFG